MAELDAAGVSAVLAADADLQVWPRCPALVILAEPLLRCRCPDLPPDDDRLLLHSQERPHPRRADGRRWLRLEGDPDHLLRGGHL